MIDFLVDCMLAMLCILGLLAILSVVISIPVALWKTYTIVFSNDKCNRSVLPVHQPRETKSTLKERITSLLGMKRSASAEYVLNTLDVSFEVLNVKHEIHKVLKLVITKITTGSPKTWTGNTDHEDGEFDKLFIDTQLSCTEEFVTTSITNKNEHETKYELVCQL